MGPARPAMTWRPTGAQKTRSGNRKMARRALQLGRPVPLPASPRAAKLDRVANPHPDSPYVARFTFPEFTALCPVTGQPDFAILLIDYVPRPWLAESKSPNPHFNTFPT